MNLENLTLIGFTVAPNDDFFKQFKELKSVTIKDSNLDEIPDFLLSLPSLKKLTITNSQIVHYPKIGALLRKKVKFNLKTYPTALLHISLPFF